MMKQINNKKIMAIGELLLFLILIVILGVSLFYIDSLEHQLIERDNTIQQLSFRSDLVEDYFDIKHDSIKNTTSYMLKDSKAKKITETQTITEIQTEYIEPSIQQGEQTISLDDFLKNVNVTNEKYVQQIENYNKLVNQFNELNANYISVLNENRNNKKTISELTTVLNLVKNNYQIDYEIKYDSVYVITSLTHTQKVDSALLLLPYFRDRLKKDNNNTWTITTRRK